MRRAEQFEFVKESLRRDNKESVTIIREQNVSFGSSKERYRRIEPILSYSVGALGPIAT